MWYKGKKEQIINQNLIKKIHARQYTHVTLRKLGVGRLEAEMAVK
jgi:hypothetical protein